MILGGTRHPGRPLIHSLSDCFEFSTDECEYFFDLIELQKSKKTSGVELLLIERLAKKRSSRCFEKMNLDQFALISKWYFPAIRELTQVGGFSLGP